MRFINIASWGLLVLINFIFVYIVVDFGLNVPYYDDFDAIGSFIFQNGLSGFWVRFVHLLDQYAEHRIGYTRLISLVYFQIFGIINFKHLILWGLSGLLGIQIFIFFSIRKFQNAGLMMFITGMMLLNFQYWENMMSAMTSLQNLSAPFFSLGTLFFLSSSPIRNNRLATYLFLCFSVFTSGNGIILIPIGLIYLIFTKQNISELIRWSFLSAFLIWVYFNHYVTPPEVFGGRSNIWEALSNPVSLFQNFTLFLTSCFNGIGLAFTYCFMIGTGFVIYMTFYVYDTLVLGNKKRSMWYAVIFVYLLGTSFLVAVNRSESLGNMLFSRYKIYSSIAMVFIFLTSLEFFSHRMVLGFFIVFSSYFAFHSLTYVSILFNHFNELRYSSYSYQINHKTWVGIYPPFTTYFTNAKNASQISRDLERAGYFRPEISLKSKEINTLDQLNSRKSCASFSINDYTYHAQFLFDSSPVWVDDFNCIIMKSSGELILVPLKFNFSAKDLLKKLVGVRVQIPTFTAIIPKSNVDHGDYKLSLIKSLDNGKIEKCDLSNWVIPYLETPQFHN